MSVNKKLSDRRSAKRKLALKTPSIRLVSKTFRLAVETSPIIIALFISLLGSFAAFVILFVYLAQMSNVKYSIDGNFKISIITIVTALMLSICMTSYALFKSTVTRSRDMFRKFAILILMQVLFVLAYAVLSILIAV